MKAPKIKKGYDKGGKVKPAISPELQEKYNLTPEGYTKTPTGDRLTGPPLTPNPNYPTPQEQQGFSKPPMPNRTFTNTSGGVNANIPITQAGTQMETGRKVTTLQDGSIMVTNSDGSTQFFDVSGKPKTVIGFNKGGMVKSALLKGYDNGGYTSTNPNLNPGGTEFQTQGDYPLSGTAQTPKEPVDNRNLGDKIGGSMGWFQYANMAQKAVRGANDQANLETYTDPNTGKTYSKYKNDTGMLTESIASPTHEKQLANLQKGNYAGALLGTDPIYGYLQQKQQAREFDKAKANSQNQEKTQSALAARDQGETMATVNATAPEKKQNILDKTLNPVFKNVKFADGGKIIGKGGPKDDAIEAKVKEGSFVVPAENAKVAEMIRKVILKKAPNMKANLKQKDGENVKLSDGEVLFSPDEVEEIEKEFGEEFLEKLAPNAMSKHEENESEEEEMQEHEEMHEMMKKMAKGGRLTAHKAREILHDGTVHGKPISEQQRKYFGAVASGTARYNFGGKVYANGGTIHINPEHKGMFTAWAKKHGMSVSEAANHVLANKDKYDTRTIRMAAFAHNFTGKAEGGMIDEYADGGKLTYKERKELPSSSFVFEKDRRYPIHDINHARNALARVSQFGSPAEKEAVRTAVKKRYPSIEQGKAEGGNIGYQDGGGVNTKKERERIAKEEQAQEQERQKQKDYKDKIKGYVYRKEVMDSAKKRYDESDAEVKKLETQYQHLLDIESGKRPRGIGSTDEVIRSAKKKSLVELEKAQNERDERKKLYEKAQNDYTPNTQKTSSTIPVVNKKASDAVSSLKSNSSGINTNKPESQQSDVKKPMIAPKGIKAMPKSEVKTETTAPANETVTDPNLTYKSPWDAISQNKQSTPQTQTTTSKMPENTPAEDNKGKAWNAYFPKFGSALETGASLAQIGLGLHNLQQQGKRPIGQIDPAFQANVDRAQAQSKYGFTPEQTALINQENQAATNAARFAARNYAGGNAGNAFNMERSAINEGWGRGLQAKIANTNLMLDKQAYATNLALQKAGMSRQLFEDKLNAWQQNQQSNALLMNTGISNLIGANRYANELEAYKQRNNLMNQ